MSRFLRNCRKEKEETMKIELFYNPYFSETLLVINNVIYRNTHSKLYGFLLQKIEQWLDKKTGLYQSWNGFFIELTEEVNEDDYEFVFYGKDKDYELISEAFHVQAPIIAEHGYNPDTIRLRKEDLYDNTLIKADVCAFIKKNREVFQDQDYLAGMSMIERDALTADTTDDASLRAIYDRLCTLLLYAKEKALDKVYWDELMQDLNTIYKKAG